MRELQLSEVAAVSGANANTTYFIDKTIGYGATGVLANVLLKGATFAAGSYGFLVGASVGAAYAAVTIVAHTFDIW